MTAMMARLAALTIVVTALLFTQSVLAGGIYFGLSVTGSQLTLTNQGDGSAFYPAVFRMLPDGRWVQLKSGSIPAELPAGAHLQLKWPDMHRAEATSEIERMQPVMVRFFDDSGVGFGQITFFNAPPPAKTVLKAGYVNGILRIEPPRDAASPINASWVLWPQEDGIEPIRLPVRFTYHPPSALRIDWRSRGNVPFKLDTGAGQPSVTLLHETAHGYTVQYVPDGGLQGKEQRAAWLDAAPQFYIASVIALVFAVGAMVLQFLRRPRSPTPLGGDNP